MGWRNKPTGIGYDKENEKLHLHYFNNGYKYYAFDMNKEDFDEFYDSNRWEKFKLKLKTIRGVKKCEHVIYSSMKEEDLTGHAYCKKCNYHKWIDKRTKEDMDLMWFNAHKNTEKEELIGSKLKYEFLLEEYISKYGESPFE